MMKFFVLQGLPECLVPTTQYLKCWNTGLFADMTYVRFLYQLSTTAIQLTHSSK